MSESPDLRNSGIPEIPISGFPEFRKSGIPDFRNFGIPEIWPLGSECLFFPLGATEESTFISFLKPYSSEVYPQAGGENPQDSPTQLYESAEVLCQPSGGLTEDQWSEAVSLCPVVES